MNSVRFTMNNVNSVFYAVKHYHSKGDGFTRYLGTAIQMGGNIGHGVRYIGMGGRMDVQYGPKGARKAVAYAYGLGVASGAWDRLRDLSETSELPFARIKFDESDALVNAARRDLGDDVFAEWEQLGRDYANKY